MLHTLIKNEHNCPTLVLMFPADTSGYSKSNNVFGKFKSVFHTSKSKLKGLFMKEMVISFVCPITKKAVESGPDGTGYRLLVPKDFVKKMAPVIAISLALAKIAIQTYGIPFPNPLPAGFTPDTYADAFMDELSGMVEEIGDKSVEGREQHEENMDAFKGVKEALELCKDAKSLSSIKEKQLASHLNIGTEVAYETIFKMLRNLENATGADASWRPKFTGLVMHTSKKDGATAWLSAEAIEQFDEQGVAAFGS